ncbi:cadherin-like protein 26 isoform 2-T2 [Hipposideros larvatus]
MLGRVSFPGNRRVASWRSPWEKPDGAAVNLCSVAVQEYCWLFHVKGESHRPLRRTKRRWIIATLELEEEDAGPFPTFVGELFNHMSENMSLMYFISGPGVDEYPETGLFSIEDHKNGKIYVHRPVDREKTPSFMIGLDVVDRVTGSIVDQSLTFHIRVRDVNDHAPQFPKEEFSIRVQESHAAGQPIFQMFTTDLDQENTPNSQVLYSLVSQTPLLKESGFGIDRTGGEIRLSGCLDYETAPRFTLLIRAMDCGEPPLSSTATVHVDVQEGNNHRPTFPQEEYKIQVPEGRVSRDVLRLLVQDGDAPFTPAWRATFNISDGNEEGHFDIVTDPETNEGILNVIKPLDYESPPTQSLVIAVENEELLFSCDGGELQWPRRAAASATVRVQVTDANEPPAFHTGTLMVSEVDGAGPGVQLGIFNATDPDRNASQIRYKLVHDPENWVTVDEHSGAVVTRKQVDRESPYVNDSFYVIIVHAVDDGLPPGTATGTLRLFLSDVNDNAPTLHPRSQHVEVCESAVTQPLLIEAEDGDLEPYSEPFTFQLDTTGGNVQDTWELGENQGRAVELLMLRSLPCGDYSVPLFIGDKQGLSQKQTVHVRVCSCAGGLTCVAEPSVAGAGLPVGVLAPLCAVFTALAVVLLFVLLRCRFLLGAKGHRGSVPRERGDQTLIVYNDESRAFSAQVGSEVRGQATGLLNTTEVDSTLGGEAINEMLSTPVRTSDQAHIVQGTLVYLNTMVPRRPLEVRVGMMAETLQQKLCGVDMLEDDTDYLPHIYSEEGECERAETLSSLAFSEQDLSPDLLDCLGSKAIPLEEQYSESGVLS